VHAPGGYGQSVGTVERLQAPSAAATGDITVGGRRFSSTLTGTPAQPRLDALHPTDGVVTVGLPASSAVLITLAGNHSRPDAAAVRARQPARLLLLPVGVVDPRHLGAEVPPDGLDLMAGLLGAHP
jgi:hypothetical protein